MLSTTSTLARLASRVISAPNRSQLLTSGSKSAQVATLTSLSSYSNVLTSQTSILGSIAASNLILPSVGQHRFRAFRKDQREEYFIMRDPPVGPHKRLAPHKKIKGRVGPTNIDYHKIIHWPEDGKYTIKPLEITKLGGRCPIIGHKIIQGIGGGFKRKYRWIDWIRLPKDWDRDGPDYEERVVEVRYDPMRDAMIALTGHGDKLRWQIATENMKAGDLIRSSGRIPKTPIRPVPGDAYALGALPVGAEICLVEFLPGDFKMVKYYKATNSVTILRKEGNRVIIACTVPGVTYSLDQRCMAVVGKVSIHPLKAAPIGSPLRKRWMGYVSRSGFWQRKTGRFGKKIKKPPPLKVIEPEEPPNYTELLLTHHDHGKRGRKRGKKRKHNFSGW